MPDVTAEVVEETPPETPAVEETPTETPVEDISTDETPTEGDDAPVTDGEAEGEVEGAAAEPAVDLQPVTVRAAGQQFTVPGALLAPEGMYVPKEHLDAVLGLIAQGRQHQVSWPQEQQRFRDEIKRRDAVSQVDIAEAVAWTAEMTKVTESEESFMAFMDNLQGNLESMKFRVQQAKVLKENEMLRSGIRLDQPATELRGQDFVQAASASLLENFDEISAGMTDILPMADRDIVWQAIARQANMYITKAPNDVPELGIVKGERVIDVDRLAGDVRRFAELRAHGRGTGKEPRAKQMNTAMQGAARVTRAPVRTTGGAPRSAPAPKPTDYDGWRESLLARAQEA